MILFRLTAISLLLCLSAISKLTAQSPSFALYHAFKNQMLDEAAAGAHETAMAFCDSMLQQVDFYPFDYYTCFEVAVKADHMGKAGHYLVLGTQKGLNISNFYSDAKDIFFNTKEGLQYLEIRDSLEALHSGSIDIPYRKALQAMKDRDQSIRDGSHAMMLNDSLVFEELIQLSAEKGFPSYRSTGTGAAYAGLILWHQRDRSPDSEQWQRLIPLIKAKIEDGELDPRFFEVFEEYRSRPAIEE